ncbi:MAG: HAD-IC family P-type ATPase [Desulfobacula sp.]|jgi:magnesium-transporting ATPase (P-type)|nr:HAD-IC family P-type ATPase [Desulfobacula sp.]
MISWYKLEAKEAFDKLQTTGNGLLQDTAQKRLLEYGPNVFARKDKVSKIKIFLHQFYSPLIFILLVAAIVTIFLHEYIDTGVILAVVILNAIIGYVQEFKAEESMRALENMVLPMAKVIRDGKEKEIKSEDLVPGDIVLLTSGVRIPADIRLFKTIELKVDEAALTGESVPAEKITTAVSSNNLTPGDQKNMGFMGTIVVSGRGRGVVVETGNNTILGQIAKDVETVVSSKTPLQNKLEKFAKLIAVIVIGFSVLVLGVGISMGIKFSEIFMIAVATSVSAIPEGLPVAVTIAMSIGISRMSRRNAIVRKLSAIETLGSTTVICSDKTGTLTKNEMTVKMIFNCHRIYDVKGSGYTPSGEIFLDKQPITAKNDNCLDSILRIGLLCNESMLIEENSSFRVDGDPTEGALIVSAIKGGLDIENEKILYPQKSILPFESERGFMATLHSNQKGRASLFLKGSPEKILEMCEDSLVKTPFDREEIVRTANFFASEGLRVLGMAYKDIDDATIEIESSKLGKGFIFAGLQGLIDPPRPEAVKAVEECKTAGIRTIMITGDHAITAVAISKKLGIGDDTGYAVCTGKEIEEMNETQIGEKARNTSIFARVSPQHKLMITRQLVNQGEVVAVTGDGVNDAPALKMAHIGIAMGRTGTDVAKEASDMILTDDNFATIVGAVEEGRVVYDNIKKVVLFLVSCGLGELIAILVTITMGLPIPYIAAQILWLNLVTNGFQDIALVFEPAEKGIMKRKPRNPKESIMSPLLIQRSLLMGIVMALGTLFVFITRLEAGVSLENARTAALTTMVFFQFYQALNCRSETESIFKMSLVNNPFLLVSLCAAFFAQLAVIYVPALQWIFRTEAISFMGWVEILSVTITIVIAVEADKWIRQKKNISAQQS